MNYYTLCLILSVIFILTILAKIDKRINRWGLIIKPHLLHQAFLLEFFNTVKSVSNVYLNVLFSKLIFLYFYNFF